LVLDICCHCYFDDDDDGDDNELSSGTHKRVLFEEQILPQRPELDPMDLSRYTGIKCKFEHGTMGHLDGDLSRYI
jgi:hypothetical protein